MEFLQYMKEHLSLVIIIAVIAVLIIALLVTIAIVAAKQKKKRSTEPDEKAEAPVSESPIEEPIPEVVEEAFPAEPASKEIDAPATTGEDKFANFIFVPVEKKKEMPADSAATKEDKTVKDEKKAAPAKKPAVAASKAAKAPEKKVVAPPAKPKKEGAIGKWVVYEEDRGGFGFKLLASNGEVMLKSSSPYASLTSAKSGIKTYQDNIAAGRVEIVETKSGNFFVQINNASKRLLATSADYKTRSSCENAAESIKRWASTTVITVESDDDKK